MPVPILRSKFRIPAYSAILRRDRLCARLDAAITHPLTVVCADAGYGKSVLVTTYLAERGHGVLWLRLDEMDRFPDVLFAYLCTGLAHLVNTAAAPLTALAERMGTHHSSPAELAAELAAALDPPPPEPIVVVLDDFETVNGSSEIAVIVHQLALLLPDTVRLLILSRTRPAGLPLSRLRLEGRLVEIGRADLTFTRPETNQLFSEVYGMALGEGELQLLHQHCEGWPAGLRLMREALVRASRPEEREHFWHDLIRTSDIFHYLWSETLAGQPPETQEFLLRTSVLAVLEPPITDVLLGMTRSRVLLSELSRAQLFTYAEGNSGKSFRYHALFRSFLHHQLEEREGPAFVRDLHRRAAALYEQQGRHNHAIAHYLAAREYLNTARVLSQITEVYPPHTFLRLFDGWLEQQTPDAQKALPSLFMRRILSRESMARLAPALKEMLAEATQSGDLLRQAHAHDWLAIEPFMRADTTAALHHYGQAAALFRELRDPRMYALALSQMGFLYWVQGDASRGRSLCAEALAVCHHHQLVIPRQHCLWVLGEMSLSSGDLDRAEQYILEALQTSGTEDTSGAHTYLTGALAAIATARGDHATAIRLAGQALTHAQLSGVRMDHGWGALYAGTAHLRAGDPEAAQPLLERAAHMLAGGVAQHEMLAALRLGALSVRRGDMGAALHYLQSGLAVAQTGNLENLLLFELATYPDLMALALQANVAPDYLRPLVRRLPAGALEPVRHLLAQPAQPHRQVLAQALRPAGLTAASPRGQDTAVARGAAWQLEFRTLGRFTVRRGDVDLTPALARRRNCRRILLYLLAHRSRSVPRDEIIEALWPGAEPEAGANCFHAALSGLRRLLEPELTSGRNSRVILREEDRYRLADEVCLVDAHLFAALAAPALRGNRRLPAQHEQALARATAMYSGDFMQEYTYEEFLTAERGWLRDLQRLALARLGDHYRLQRQAGKALPYYQKALALDPCSEVTHRRLIFTHLLAGDRATAIRAWQFCATTLEKELDVSPDPTTQAVARKFLGA